MLGWYSGSQHLQPFKGFSQHASSMLLVLPPALPATCAFASCSARNAVTAINANRCMIAAANWPALRGMLLTLKSCTATPCKPGQRLTKWEKHPKHTLIAMALPSNMVQDSALIMLA